MYTIDKINALLSERGKTGADLTRALGLSNGVYSQWNTRTTQPSARNLKKIADFFGVPVSQLTDDSNTESQAISRTSKGTPVPVDERQAYWAERLNALSPSDQALVAAVVARLQENPEATRAGIGLLLGAVQSAPRAP